MKVVLDTNIWISGILFPKSKAGKFVEMWRSFKVDIVSSKYILDEIKKVLLYPKIRKRIQWDEKKIDQYILMLKFFTHHVSIENVDKNIVVPSDHNDSPILHTLIASKTDYLITGDSDLLALNAHYPIITLAELYEFSI